MPKPVDEIPEGGRYAKRLAFTKACSVLSPFAPRHACATVTGRALCSAASSCSASAENWRGVHPLLSLARAESRSGMTGHHTVLRPALAQEYLQLVSETCISAGISSIGFLRKFFLQIDGRARQHNRLPVEIATTKNTYFAASLL